MPLTTSTSRLAVHQAKHLTGGRTDAVVPCGRRAQCRGGGGARRRRAGVAGPAAEGEAAHPLRGTRLLNPFHIKIYQPLFLSRPLNFKASNRKRNSPRCRHSLLPNCPAFAVTLIHHFPTEQCCTLRSSIILCKSLHYPRPRVMCLCVCVHSCVDSSSHVRFEKRVFYIERCFSIQTFKIEKRVF